MPISSVESIREGLPRKRSHVELFCIDVITHLLPTYWLVRAFSSRYDNYIIVGLSKVYQNGKDGEYEAKGFLQWNIGRELFRATAKQIEYEMEMNRFCDEAQKPSEKQAGGQAKGAP